MRISLQRRGDRRRRRRDHRPGRCRRWPRRRSRSAGPAPTARPAGWPVGRSGRTGSASRRGPAGADGRPDGVQDGRLAAPAGRGRRGRIGPPARRPARRSGLPARAWRPAARVARTVAWHRWAAPAGRCRGPRRSGPVLSWSYRGDLLAVPARRQGQGRRAVVVVATRPVPSSAMMVAGSSTIAVVPPYGDSVSRTWMPCRWASWPTTYSPSRAVLDSLNSGGSLSCSLAASQSRRPRCPGRGPRSRSRSRCRPPSRRPGPRSAAARTTPRSRSVRPAGG